MLSAVKLAASCEIFHALIGRRNRVVGPIRMRLYTLWLAAPVNTYLRGFIIEPRSREHQIPTTLNFAFILLV